MSEVLKIQNLCKSYWLEKKEISVLKDISFTVNPGNLLSIVGASGAGKSTLLQLIGALDKPSSGEIFFEGESIFRKNDQQLAMFRNKKVGFVFQFHHLLTEFSALENVMMPALISGVSKDLAFKKAQDKLCEMGLEKRLYHKPGELSGGEKQRVAIARALILQPPLLLADELTGNLDTKTGEHIIELLFHLNQEHRTTMIIVTHNESLAQRMPLQLKMSDGKLLSIPS